MVSEERAVNGFEFDHLVVKVASLERAIQDFRAAGFAVAPGGSHGLTENALIVFKDGTYIELLAVQNKLKSKLMRLASAVGLLSFQASRRSDIYSRLIPWIGARVGPIDWCVRVTSLEQIRRAWEKQGVACLDSQSFHRALPDGRSAKWLLGGGKDSELPFLLEDISERTIRVPDSSTDHANGATGIRRLIINPKNHFGLYRRLQTVFASQISETEGKVNLSLGSSIVQFCQSSDASERFAVEISVADADTTKLDTLRICNTQILIPRSGNVRANTP